MQAQQNALRFIEEAWIECLGDFAHYRMAIKDDDIRDKGVDSSFYKMVSESCVLSFRVELPMILGHQLAHQPNGQATT